MRFIEVTFIFISILVILFVYLLIQIQFSKYNPSQLFQF